MGKLEERERTSAVSPFVELVDRWRMSERTLESHNALLAPYQVRQIVVNMDGGGYNELTRTLPLFEVLHIVDHLKREFFTFGKSIGGEARGSIWEADNASMVFHHDQVLADQVLWRMIELMGANKRHPMRMALTVGVVNGYKIGQELYGDEVHELDDIGENTTPGGALYVTPAFATALTDPQLRYLLLPSLDGVRSLSVDVDNVVMMTPQLEAAANNYPLPFSPAFGHFISAYREQSPRRVREVAKRYLSRKTVVFIKAHHRQHPLLLDELTAYREVDQWLHGLLSTGVFRVKSNGVIGIFATDNARVAVDFAKEAAADLARKGLVYSIGVAAGETAMFRLGGGWGKLSEIAGRSVNDASFLAEDQGQLNMIAVEESVAELLGLTEGKVVGFEKSGQFMLEARHIRGTSNV